VATKAPEGRRFEKSIGDGRGSFGAGMESVAARWDVVKRGAKSARLRKRGGALGITNQKLDTFAGVLWVDHPHARVWKERLATLARCGRAGITGFGWR